MYLYKALERCLLCASADLSIVLALEPISIATPNFTVPPGVDDAEVLRGVPLALHQCRVCGHLQVGQIGNPELQYREYVYTTKLSPGLAEHFADYARSVLERIAPAQGALIVEIGSNDGTLLRSFNERGMRVIGVDPATRIASEASAAGIMTLPEFFSAELASRIRAEHGPASVVIANNVIANVHDLRDFADGIRSLLSPDGVFIFETQYGRDVVERRLLDTIYHEHLSYFMIKPISAFFARHGMQLIDVARTASKGGSIRVTVQLAGGTRSRQPIVAELIAEEESAGAFGAPFYDALADATSRAREELRAIVARDHRSGRLVAGYGVSVGTLTLLAQFGLTGMIDFMVDDDPNKEPFLQGPGYRIPVVRAAELVAKNPASVVIFAWRYADSIISRQQAYLESGGSFVIPLAQVRVVRAATSTGAKAR